MLTMFHMISLQYYNHSVATERIGPFSSVQIIFCEVNLEVITIEYDHHSQLCSLLAEHEPVTVECP